MHTLVDGKLSHESQIWYKSGWHNGSTEPGRKAAGRWNMKKAGELQKMNIFSTDSEEKLQENSLVVQMWYFLTVAYLLGVRTRQI